MSRFDIAKACAAGPVRVHLGGESRAPGWININPAQGPYVDIRGDHRKLALFAPGSVAAIYASHVLEHLDPRTEARTAMELVLRALAPGGALMAAVPDLFALCRIYVDPATTSRERFLAMRAMFGGHADAFDVHHTGFDEESLRTTLAEIGFVQIERVKSFGLFDDTSDVALCGVDISLNMIAHKSY
jgi:predicted SAM-dependent methyltransferase